MPVIVYGNAQLEVVFDYTYLGITFNYNNNFKKAIAKQVSQAKRAMYALIAKCKRLRLPVDIQCHLFDSLIVPILLYGCEIWGFENYEAIKILHRKYIKQMLGLRKSTPGCMVYGESGKTKLKAIIDNRMMTFWCRIITGNRDKITYVMYQLARHMHSRNVIDSKWISHVNNMLNNTGFGGMWEGQDDFPSNPTWFKQATKLRLSDIALQTWHEDVESHRDCSFYSLFKEVPKISPYMSLNFKYRLLIAKFICRNLNLPIEMQCPLCSTDISDEFHLLLSCPFLRRTRSQYLPRNICVRPNVLKLQNLMRDDDISIWRNIGRFIEIIVSCFELF